MLQNVATHLFAKGEMKLARTVINEAENLQAIDLLLELSEQTKERLL